MSFPLGQVVMTAGIAAAAKENAHFALKVNSCLYRHSCGDWGDLCEDDKKANDQALKDGDRLLSAYKFDDQKVYVITEWDRSVTTILFPDEY